MKVQPLITITKTQPLAQLYLELAKAWYVKENYGEAIGLLGKALDHNTEADVPTADILLLMAAAYTSNNQPELAIQPYLLAMGHAPADASKILEQVTALDNRGLSEDMATWIENNWYPFIIDLKLSREQQASINQFLGGLLSSRGRPGAEQYLSKAAGLFFEEGKRLYWDTKYDAASRYFERSAALQSQVILTYWYWADALFLGSYLPEKPYADMKMLEQAYTVWKTGLSHGTPGREDSWAYFVKARILIQQSAVKRVETGEEDAGLLREAWVALEQSVLLKGNDFNSWRNLATTTRLLGFNHVSLAAAKKATSISGEDQTGKEELAINLLDLGNSAEAREMLTAFANDPQTDLPVYKAWIGITYYDEKDYAKTIELLNEYLKAVPEDDWTLNGLMNCYWKLGKMKQARENARKVLSLAERGVRINAILHGFCRYVLGEVQQAIDLAEDALKDPDLYLAAAIDLQIYYLHEGNINQSADYLDKILRLTLRPFQLNEILRNNETLVLLSRKEKWENARELQQVVNDKVQGFAIQINRRREELASNRNLVHTELEQALSTHPSYGAEGSPAWMAVTASMARNYIEQSDFPEAAACYERLRTHSRTFPEASQGSILVMQAAIVRGIREQDLGYIGQAERMYLGNPRIKEEFVWDDAVKERLANAILTESDPVDMAWKVIDTVDRAGRETDPAFGTFLNHGLRHSLLQRIAARYKPSSEINLYPVVSPILVEMNPGLMPATEQAFDDWPFIKQDLEALRSEIKGSTGVDVARIRVRQNEFLGEWQYQFLLQEIPIISYFSQSGDKSGTLTEAVANLRALILKELSSMIDLDQVYRYIDEWKKENKSFAERASELFPDNDPLKKVRFLKLLRRLLHERVFVGDWKQIILALGSTGLRHDDVHADLREVRLALKPYLPGNRLNTNRIALPADLEEWIVANAKENNHKYYFSALPGETQDWLNRFRDFVSEQQKDMVLTVENADARPFLNQVIESEFADITVMSSAELMSYKDIEEWVYRRDSVPGTQKASMI